jgi:uncharacterized membrane protein YbaN (DUF454 family)
MTRVAWFTAGWVSLLVGAIGAVLPLLPTVPLVILAAFCFARSSPSLERRLIEHPRFGPHILAWRRRGAISRGGKRAALAAFAVSAAVALASLPLLWALGSLAAALIGGGWVLSRPSD